VSWSYFAALGKKSDDHQADLRNAAFEPKKALLELVWGLVLDCFAAARHAVALSSSAAATASSLPTPPPLPSPPPSLPSSWLRLLYFSASSTPFSS
jgi:hypothetical protein